MNIKKKIIFPDHYNFKKNEIDEILNSAEREDCQIIMTEKDYFKFKGYKTERINFLSVKLQIQNKEKLLRRIKVYMIRYLITFTINHNLLIFLVGRIVGLKISRNLFSLLFSFLDSMFKSKKIIEII